LYNAQVKLKPLSKSNKHRQTAADISPPATFTPQSNTRRQRTEVRRQIFRSQILLFCAPCSMRSDRCDMPHAYNQLPQFLTFPSSWIVPQLASRALILINPKSAIEKPVPRNSCPAPRNSQPVLRNPQPVPRNPQLVPRNPQLAPRNPWCNSFQSEIRNPQSKNPQPAPTPANQFARLRWTVLRDLQSCRPARPESRPPDRRH